MPLWSLIDHIGVGFYKHGAATQLGNTSKRRRLYIFGWRDPGGFGIVSDMKSQFSSRQSRTVTRRQFIATTAAAIAAPTFIPASALGKDGRPAPSERIVVGIVGWGMMGPGNTDG